MKAEDVGRLFTTDGNDVWKLVAYCEHPTATLVNSLTGEKVYGAIGSPNLQRFVRLVPEVGKNLEINCLCGRTFLPDYWHEYAECECGKVYRLCKDGMPVWRVD